MSSPDEIDALEHMALLEVVESIAAAQSKYEWNVPDLLTDGDKDEVVISLTEAILEILFHDASGGERIHGGSVPGHARNQNGNYDDAVTHIKKL